MASNEEIKEAGQFLGHRFPPEFIDRDEVARLLQTSVHGVDLLRKGRQIPAVSFPHNVFLFRIADIVDYIASQKKLPKKTDAGYVYVLSADEFQPVCKVGFSTYASKKRVDAANTYCPFDIVLITEYRVRKSREAESVAHAALDDRHVKGEWFNMEGEGFAILERALQDFIVDK